MLEFVRTIVNKKMEKQDFNEQEELIRILRDHNLGVDLNKPVVLYDNNPKWGDAFLEIEDRISHRLKKIGIQNTKHKKKFKVHHIGSTAIPAIKSKNLLDYSVFIDMKTWGNSFTNINRALKHFGQAPSGLQDEEQILYSKYNLGNKYSNHITKAIIFTKFMNENPEKAKLYEKIKVYGSDNRMDYWEYTALKKSFIENVHKKAEKYYSEEYINNEILAL